MVKLQVMQLMGTLRDLVLAKFVLALSQKNRNIQLIASLVDKTRCILPN